MDWATLDAATRWRPVDMTVRTVPSVPGVYAWYRRGRAVYVGKGDDLQDRIWSRHLGQSRTLRTSSLRRNVAEYLGFGEAEAIRSGRIVLTDEQRQAVRAWIMGCRVAWVSCPSIAAAARAEADLKFERMPALTKR